MKMKADDWTIFLVAVIHQLPRIYDDRIMTQTDIMPWYNLSP